MNRFQGIYFNEALKLLKTDETACSVNRLGHCYQGSCRGISVDGVGSRLTGNLTIWSQLVILAVTAVID